MNNNIEKGQALYNLYDGEAKCRIESEGILPDYCPDIKRVIKVDVNPRIISKRAYIDGNNILCEVEGSASFNVLYLGGEEDRVFSYVFYNDFEHNFKLPASQNEEYDLLCAVCSAYSENINCKPQSPRKISLRCDVNLCMNLKCNRSFTYYSPEEDKALGRIEVMENTADVCMISSFYEGEFSLSDSIKLPSEYPAIGDIADFEGKIICDSASFSPEKISFRATAVISFAYRSDDGERYISLCQPIELSQAIDNEGIDADENMHVSVQLTPESLNLETDINDDGEAKTVKFDFNYSAAATVMKNYSATLAADAYGIGKDAAFEREEADFYSLVSAQYDTFSLRETTDIRADGTESIRARADHRSFVMENGRLYSMSKLYINMLCQNKGSLEHQRKNIDIKLPVQLPAELMPQYEKGNVKIDFFCDVKSIDCRKGDNGMDIFADISERVFVYLKPNTSYIKTMQISELEEPREEMILYYPCDDDTLWSIGKKYKVSQEYLKRENNITDSSLPDIVKI